MLTASSTGCTRLYAVSGSPFSANWSSTCRPLADVAGGRAPATWPVDSTAASTAPVADRSAALSGDAAELEIITSSDAGSLMPALTSVQVARPDSPTPYSAWFMVTWPTMLPTSMVTMTSASHAPTAVSRCRALHPPSVAARLGRRPVAAARAGYDCWVTELLIGAHPCDTAFAATPSMATRAAT